MEIKNSTIGDLSVIFNFYDMAVAFQKTKFNKHWQAFDSELVETEISEKRQWKIIIDNTVACIFAITYSDKNIWGDRDNDNAIYIHRIVTHPNYRGNNFVVEIINWAKIHAKEKNKKFIRLDTWGDNQKLREHYTKCGFNYSGVITPSNTEELPKHYSAITLSLFEIAL